MTAIQIPFLKETQCWPFLNRNDTRWCTCRKDVITGICEYWQLPYLLLEHSHWDIGLDKCLLIVTLVSWCYPGRSGCLIRTWLKRSTFLWRKPAKLPLILARPLKIITDLSCVRYFMQPSVSPPKGWKLLLSQFGLKELNCKCPTNPHGIAVASLGGANDVPPPSQNVFIFM